MNKKDLIPVIILALLIPVWMLIDQKFIAPKFPSPAPVPAEQTAQPAPEIGNIEAADLTDATKQAKAIAQEAATEARLPTAEEQTAVLENEKVKLELTSFGGGIKSATLLDYPQHNEKESDPVVLDFSDSTALAYEGLPGIGATDALALETTGDGKSVVFTKVLEDGAVFKRTITLGEHYMVTVKDQFANPTANALTLSDLRILTGRMKNPADMESMKGMPILGADSYSPDGGLHYWGRKLNGLYKQAGKPVALDAVPEEVNGQLVDWVSAKNKFFTQILRTEQPIATMAVLSERDANEKGTIPVNVAAAMVFKSPTIAAGSQYNIAYDYYIGPKKYSVLKDAGYHMDKIMEFETIGWWSFMNWLMEPARKFLLHTMNVFKSVIPGGYGVAIILLTLLVRILFWPLTHKSTESMKRMQELQPEIKALQAKYAKSNPQKLQQETMKLYKERKVNPMGGCLPMFVQIPVFFALYTVLRNAIELRFASFLWIADLSTSENLFAGHVPFVGSLNILPLLMSASMIWQQKMTPTAAATPEQQQQQKMMMFMMPIMMLFFFYKMPSGLVLYWTTSNLLMIAQTSIRNLRKKKKEA